MSDNWLDKGLLRSMFASDGITGDRAAAFVDLARSIRRRAALLDEKSLPDRRRLASQAEKTSRVVADIIKRIARDVGRGNGETIGAITPRPNTPLTGDAAAKVPSPKRSIVRARGNQLNN